MATHSSILAWRVPQTEEPGGLHPWGREESDMTERLTLSLSCELLVCLVGSRSLTRDGTQAPGLGSTESATGALRKVSQAVF